MIKENMDFVGFIEEWLGVRALKGFEGFEGV